jgi:hypothetical protein
MKSRQDEEDEQDGEIKTEPRRFVLSGLHPVHPVDPV